MHHDHHHEKAGQKRHRVVHGDHEDVIVNNVLHCDSGAHPCFELDLVDIPAATDWDDFLDL